MQSNLLQASELADILINTFEFTLLDNVYEVNPLVNDLTEQVKEILIELEADNGVYITPAHYLLVPMNEVGFAYMRDVAYNILALIQDPTCYDNVPDSPYSSDSSSGDGDSDNETATYLFI
jgi:hypothetical protein